ncbi:MAG TPA: four helix bundle protein [Sediminibacterium sp.]|nr:four helix bundle protein [Sediminibacterium sp.]
MSQTLRPDISVYQHAISVAGEVFRLTCLLPLQQRFVLTGQLRKSITLVCNRLSVFAGSNSKLQLKRNSELFIPAYAELKTQIKMSQSFGYFKPEELTQLETCLDQILHFCRLNLEQGQN